MAKKTKRVRFSVDAHHNVEDFRPYKVSFEDRGSIPRNVEQALWLAIKREGEWLGWFNSADECGDLGGKRVAEIKKAVFNAVYQAWGKGGTKEGVVYGYDFDEKTNEPKLSKNHGLVIWVHFSKLPENCNFGFGYANKDADQKGPLRSVDTDKYDNKWVSPAAR